MQLASYLEGGQVMPMIPLHLHVYQKSDYDGDSRWFCQMPAEWIYSVFKKRINLGSTGQEFKY